MYSIALQFHFLLFHCYPQSPRSHLCSWNLFQLELQYHPDQAAVAYVISGICEGVHISFQAYLVT